MFFHTNQFIDAAAPTMSNPLKQLFGFETDGHQPLCKKLELFREPHSNIQNVYPLGSWRSGSYKDVCRIQLPSIIAFQPPGTIFFWNFEFRSL
jgi:hypothetical protein